MQPISLPGWYPAYRGAKISTESKLRITCKSQLSPLTYESFPNETERPIRFTCS